MSESKIKLFEIKGLFYQFDVSIPLNNQVNVFVGENGVGKTTILNCLNCVLNGDIEKLNQIVFDEISIVFINNEKVVLKHDDLSIYMNSIGLPSLFYKKGIKLDTIFTFKEIDSITNLYKNKSNDNELRKYYMKVSETFDVPVRLAQRELDNFVLRKIMNFDQSKADHKRVEKFFEKVRMHITEEVIYFPTYRRIEEDISNLGIDIELDKIRNKLIQFGMSDVEKSINKLLDTIKSVSISGFTKMTGLLLKQYLNGELSNLHDYKIDKEKLIIALARIGDEIDESDKKRISELVNSDSIYLVDNIYLLNLIKNLIDSYEKQNQYDERIKKFVAVCNNYLNGKKYIYDESNLKVKIVKDETHKSIHIQNLSSGEKQIISIFSKLYIEDIESCIILFDEPELSLSILWQKMFLPDIIKSQKCTTLVAVTHSPFIFDNEFDKLAKDIGSFIAVSHGGNE